ncbi:MAG: hypothetical protein K8R21_03150 [Leptospira sp.]|nr:hypothetical protein [Leptospira sp.]
MNTIFRIEFYAIILTFHVLFQCQSKHEDRNALAGLVMNNLASGSGSTADGFKSMIDLTRADLAKQSYTGNCFDTFQLDGVNVSPSTYYNTYYGGSGGQLNSDIRKVALSKSDCTALGFAGPSNTNYGSASQRPDPKDKFTFKQYSCDPNNNPCPKAGITATGF